MCFSYRNQHITFLLLVVLLCFLSDNKKRNYASHLHGVRYAKTNILKTVACGLAHPKIITRKAIKKETRVYLLVDRTDKHQYETGYMELKQVKLFFLNINSLALFKFHICSKIFIRRLNTTHWSAHWLIPQPIGSTKNQVHVNSMLACHDKQIPWVSV